LKKVFKKIFLFLALMIVLSFLVNRLLIFGLHKSDNYEFKKFIDIKENKNYFSLLVLGSSKARNHYNNFILDSSLNVKSFCIGSIASFLDVNKMMLEYYLKYNKPPKYLLLDLSIYSVQALDKLPFIAQYMGTLDEDIIYDFLLKKDKSFWLYKNIPLSGLLINRYALRESLYSFRFLFSGSKSNETTGYIPLDGDFFGKRYAKYQEYVSKGPETVSIDNDKIKNLYDIINICRENNIKIVLVFSPIYNGFLNNIENREFIISTFKKASIENNVMFMDYSQNSMGSQQKYFFDLDHLNRKGADEFSKLLAKDLKNIIN
jgi:hypothetical protein